jgi:hypothetical protein
MKNTELDFDRIQRWLDQDAAYFGIRAWNNHQFWNDADILRLEQFCESDADLASSAAELKRLPSAAAHKASRLGLKLPREWVALIRPKRKLIVREPRTQLAYPFIIKARGDAADLLEVNSMVPAYLPGREDVCQEIMLALFEGAITIDDLRKNKGQIRTFIKAFRRDNWEEGGYAISLDAPMHDGRSWHDVLSNEQFA